MAGTTRFQQEPRAGDTCRRVIVTERGEMTESTLPWLCTSPRLSHNNGKNKIQKYSQLRFASPSSMEVVLPGWDVIPDCSSVPGGTGTAWPWGQAVARTEPWQCRVCFLGWVSQIRGLGNLTQGCWNPD